MRSRLGNERGVTLVDHDFPARFDARDEPRGTHARSCIERARQLGHVRVRHAVVKIRGGASRA